MAELTVYSLKSCDTCRKALREIEAAGMQATVVDVRADGIAPAEMQRLLTAVGPEYLVNRRSTTWRGLDDDTRSRAMSADGADVLCAHPTLMKRPVICVGDAVHVGWNADTKAAILG